MCPSASHLVAQGVLVGFEVELQTSHYRRLLMIVNKANRFVKTVSFGLIIGEYQCYEITLTILPITFSEKGMKPRCIHLKNQVFADFVLCSLPGQNQIDIFYLMPCNCFYLPYLSYYYFLLCFKTINKAQNAFFAFLLSHLILHFVSYFFLSNQE